MSDSTIKKNVTLAKNHELVTTESGAQIVKSQDEGYTYKFKMIICDYVRKYRKSTKK